MSAFTFKSINGLSIALCDDPAIIRPFKVMIELQDQGGPNISAIKYYVRRCDATVSTMELYRDLNKAMEITKETYDEIMKIKQTWCEHQVLTGKMSSFEVTPGMCPKQVPDQLEEFLLKAACLNEWPTSGNPIHWYIFVKDEDWFNELANLHQKVDLRKGDFTEIVFVPDNFIHFAGWRGNVMFTSPLYPKEEKPVYTLKEGIKKISEFIIAGKIKIPGFEYN